jgi:hypothetical protein
MNKTLLTLALAYIAPAVLAESTICKDKYSYCPSLIGNGCCYGRELTRSTFNQACCDSCKKVEDSTKCKKKKLDAIAYAKNDLAGRKGLMAIKFEHKKSKDAIKGNHTCTKPEERSLLD